MTSAHKVLRITSKTTTEMVDHSVFLLQLIISCSNAGTAWTLLVQDGVGTPNIIVPIFTLAVPTNGQPIIVNFSQVQSSAQSAIPQRGVYMESGINIVTAGTTAGVVNVWADYTEQ